MVRHLNHPALEVGRAREGRALSEGRSGRVGGTYKRLPQETVIGARMRAAASLSVVFLHHQIINDHKACSYELPKRGVVVVLQGFSPALIRPREA